MIVKYIILLNKKQIVISAMPIFPHYTQLDAMDCGPTCLRMIAKHYGRSYTLQSLRERSYITREGVSMLGTVVDNAWANAYARKNSEPPYAMQIELYWTTYYYTIE